MKKLTLKWHPRMFVTKLIFCNICGIALAAIIASKIATIAADDIHNWWFCVNGSILEYMIFQLLVFYLILIKAKNKKTRISLIDCVCSKGRKSIKYVRIRKIQTPAQKIFGLITLVFYSQDGRTIKVRNVDEKAWKYLK